jgi:hypothetical protein
MTAPSKGVADILVAAGIGQFGGNSDWSIRIGRSKDSPDRGITIYDGPGQPPEPGLDINRPSVEISIRGGQNDYVEAYTKAEAIRDALLGYPTETINGDLWASVTMLGDIMCAGYDEKERPWFTLSIQIILHQGDLSGSYRISC